MSDLTEQISPVEPGGLASTADVCAVAKTARAACQKANFGQTPNHRQTIGRGTYSCHFVIDTKAALREQIPRFWAIESQSAFGAATAVRMLC